MLLFLASCDVALCFACFHSWVRTNERTTVQSRLVLCRYVPSCIRKVWSNTTTVVNVPNVDLDGGKTLPAVPGSWSGTCSLWAAKQCACMVAVAAYMVPEIVVLIVQRRQACRTGYSLGCGVALPLSCLGFRV